MKPRFSCVFSVFRSLLTSAKMDVTFFGTGGGVFGSAAHNGNLQKITRNKKANATNFFIKPPFWILKNRKFRLHPGQYQRAYCIGIESKPRIIGHALSFPA